MGTTRRVKASRDLLLKSSHYLKQYHSMLVPWAIKTIEGMEPGLNREKMAVGLGEIFKDIEGNIARLLETAETTPDEIVKELASLKTPEYDKLISKEKIQEYIHVVKNNMHPRAWIGVAKKGISAAFSYVILKGLELSKHFTEEKNEHTDTLQPKPNGSKKSN